VIGQRPQLAVFGGGGLLSLLRAVFPHALFVAARSGALTTAQGTPALPSPAESPSVLIWSVGRSRHQQDPPSFLRPRLVFDLNYAADSPGRDFAAQVGAHYVDGSDFFVQQAAAQQLFWKQHLATKNPSL
jgi:shikimate 5-dehydrogenase